MRSGPIATASAMSVGLLVGLLVGPPAAATATEPDVPGTVTSDRGVEVTTYGVVVAHQFHRVDRPLVTVAVHAVQRVDDATVVYLSLGSDDPDALTSGPLASTVVEQVGTQLGARYAGGDGLSDTRLIDSDAGEVLTVVPRPSSTAPLARPFVSDRTASPTEPGVMAVVYAVLPPLADDTETVDVQIAYGSLITDVPVGEGPLAPAVATGEPIPVGTGWPDVDGAALRQLPDPDLSRHPLEVVVEDLERTRTTIETGEEVTVDVAADVLFAFDSADLSVEALAVLDTVTADIDDRATGGQVRIVGHTDSIASDAYNDDLSLRRAQAVAQALDERLTDAPELIVEGRGKREPVASNATPEGRQANRRVAVTFEVDAEERP